MEDETFKWVMVGGMILLLFLIFSSGKLLLRYNNIVSEGLNCNQVVDMIFEQCSEESNISIQTMKGKRVQLEYDRGVCIIK